ncbi:hypothetical protein HK105_208795 [Polyrhizophydium stewartii]|uniref:RING-type domain-containing protein n=1 Tax=Polyrhizophydium stewartii TaxID=2732419 RepID=A0ABR4MWV4_9FUNG
MTKFRLVFSTSGVSNAVSGSTTPTAAEEPAGEETPGDTLRPVPCPVCGIAIASQDLAAHYAYELATLDSNPLVLPGGSERSRRSAAVAALGKLNERAKAPALDEHEKAGVLHKIRGERVKRAAGRGRLIGAARKRQRNSHGLFDDVAGADTSICFICGMPLPNDSESINAHIDNCLANGPPNGGSAVADLGVSALGHAGIDLAATTSDPPRTSTPASEPWLEYSFNGQTRIRATALLEGNFEASGFSVHKRTDVDTDEDIDIDDDGTAEFGAAQFGEEDIQPYLDIEGEEDDEDLLVAALEASAQTGRQPAPDESAEEPPVDAEALAAAATEAAMAKFDASAALLPGETRLIIESLKARVRSLESSSASVPKCLICLEPYTEPLASTGCWHVHCQACWLHTLASKRLCPQCQKITAPSDLRRIYL